MEQPVILTPRLSLRALQLRDAPDIQRLAAAREVAENTLSIPHPYEDGYAEEWIRSQADDFKNQKAANFLILLRAKSEVCGVIGLILHPEHSHAELGYWIGVPYWNNGYGTEAAKAVVDFGFDQLNLERIYAYHFKRNPASGRVLQKIGMIHEGCLRQHIRKREHFEDLICYGILRKDWQKASRTQR
jgi:ribosomal-protein-alanine N-acetyltransferase